MGLDVTLMPLRRLLSDEKRASEHKAFLDQTGLSLPAGNEEDLGYSEQVGPYAVFHHLWRYAAHVEVNGRSPAEPGTHPLDDPAYTQAMAKPQTRFDHLLRHSDQNGYYYPIDFPTILNIVPRPEVSGFFKKVFGGSKAPVTPISFGSAIRLKNELMEINEHLKVPVRDEAPSETYADGIHGDEWGDEKWSWVVLYFMCRKAIEHGQIMVFE